MLKFLAAIVGRSRLDEQPSHALLDFSNKVFSELLAKLMLRRIRDPLVDDAKHFGDVGLQASDYLCTSLFLVYTIVALLIARHYHRCLSI
ncbi:hypothetical protein K461DRAFT_86837 [Myriangium duriaei CBS 260.36]|uniref:Uncharacterized protein n=1 Tax=Myriangium duriaei CBS 260.36 TaxID=1168546 RepID=A0A9P4J8G4_9PEZI|nr:hypothetical protein K461DRAFT_86837 [Myriangium duriaei CBS 260.36]